jgi:hypothetical protein
MCMEEEETLGLSMEHSGMVSPKATTTETIKKMFTDVFCRWLIVKSRRILLVELSAW